MMVHVINKRFVLFLLGLMTVLVTLSFDAQAAPRPFAVRYSTNVNGNLAQTGNTVMVCTPCGATNISSTMLDFDGDTDLSTFNSSSADLTIPSGSTILWAGLYWGSRSVSPSIGQVLFKRPGAFGYAVVNASQLDTAVGGQANEYGGYADVTSIVSAGGSGTYWVGNVQTTSPSNVWGGWSLIVAYENSSEPLNNITVFDGYQIIRNATGITMNMSGFLTPLSGPVVTRIGLVGWDGDDGVLGGGGYTGDAFRVNGIPLFDSCNPTTNDFFNSTICNLGIPNEARFPNTASYPTGMFNTMGTDVDLVQIASGIILNGATSASLQFTTNGELFSAHAAAFVTNLYVPIVTPNVVKTVVDLDGGDLLIGDTMRYTISMTNSGQDTATNVIVNDPIPAFTTYVPNSLQVVNGPNTGAKSDIAGDDQAEYIATGIPRVVFRIGTGADAVNGGNLPFYTPPPVQTSISFDVTVDSGIPTGTLISNSAEISYSGQTLPGNSYSTSSSAATANVLAPATINKTFSPSTIDVNQVSQLQITVANAATNPAAINGVTFTDNYPPGLINATPANAAITCTPGSTPGALTGGVAGGNAIGMSPGANLAVGGSCTVTVDVTSSIAGNYTNTTSGAGSINAGTGAPASTVLSVGKPSISKTFVGNPILAGNNSRLTLTITNSLAANLTGVAFTDSYPAGLVNATVPNTATTCGGTVTAAAGGNSLSLAGGNVASLSNCTVSVDVSSNTAGIYANASGGVSSIESGAAGNGSNTANLTVVGPPQAVKSFSPASVGVGLDAELRITISNPNTTTALTGISFTDTYPANLLNSLIPNATLDCTPGSSAVRTGGTAGSSTIGMSTGSLAPSGSCWVTVNVNSAVAGAYLNDTGTITSANGGTGAAANATLTVSNLVSPSVSKAFAPASIVQNGTSVLTITLNNANGVPVTGAAIIDSYPVNIVNAALPAAATTCAGGVVTAVAGAGSVALTGGTIPAGGNCTVTVTVTGSVPGSYNNNLPIGALSTTNAGSSALSASAILDVVASPVISKTFTPDTVAVNSNSLLTITVSNPNTVTALTGVAFTDTYPPNVTNNGGVVSSNCTAGGTVGTVTGVNGGNSLSRSGTTIAPNGSCTITINVRANAAGTYLNTTGPVTSTNGGAGIAASATLSVGQPGISKVFAPTIINTNGTSLLTITLTNPTPAAMTLAAFTDTYPAGMTNATVPAGATTCALGTVTALPGGPSVALSGGTIPANGTCTVTVTVQANGTVTNTIPAGGMTVSGPASNATPASASLTVNPAPIASKSFSPASIAKNGTSTLTVTVQNNNNVAMTGVAFTDTYPAGLVNTGTPTVTATPASCTFTTLTAAAGGNTLALTGGTIPLNSACNYTVQVTSPTEGNYLNDTGAVSSVNFGIGAAATSTLTVTPSAPTITKSFSPAAITAGATSVMSIAITNPNLAAAITGAALNDLYPAGMTNTNFANPSFNCAGAVVASNNGNSVQLSSATIPANSTCTLTVNVTSALGGDYTNNTGAVTTTNTTDGLSAAGVLSVVGPPNVAKAFAPATIAPGATSVLTITLTNPNLTTPLTGINFTDTYPVDITNSAAPSVATTCGGVATATPAGADVTLTGGTIAAGGSCSVTVNVTATVLGAHTNTIPIGGVSSSAGNTVTSASAILTVTNLPTPTVTKTFTPSAQTINRNTLLTITLTNPTAIPITGVAFTDNYPVNLFNRTGGNLINTCGGTAVRTTVAPFSLSLTGGTIPANGSCVVSFNRVRASALGAYLNDTGPITSTNGNTVPGATATLTVQSLAATKAFVPTTVSPNASSTLTFTITNGTNAHIPNGITLIDTYPVGLVNATPLVTGGTCVGTFTAVAGGTGVQFVTTGQLNRRGGSCTVTIDVTSPSQGSYVNTLPIGAVTDGVSPTLVASSDTLTVAISPPNVSKSLAPAAIVPGANSVLTITLTNPNATVPVTGINFTDTYPLDVTNAALPVVTTDCGGVATATPGGSDVTLTGGSLPSGGSCTVKVNVTATVLGVHTNTIPIGGVSSSAGNNTVAASASVTVTNLPTPTVTKTFLPAAQRANRNTLLTITLTNPTATPITGVAFTDNYPANMSNNTGGGGGNLVNTCGGVAVRTAVAPFSLSLTGGTIPANGSCIVSYDRVRASVLGVYVNNTGPVTSTNGTTVPGATGTLTIESLAAEKAFTPTAVLPNVSSTLTFTITNGTNVTIPNGITLIDTYPAGMVNATPLVTGGTCVGTFTAVAGGPDVQFVTTGALARRGGSCTVTIDVTSATPGEYLNTLPIGAVTDGLSPTLVASSANLTVIAPPVVTKSFSPTTVPLSGISTMTVTLINTNAVGITGLAFTDTYPANLLNNAGLVNTCGSTATATPATSTMTLVGGIIPANGGCTISVPVTSAIGGSYVNTLAIGSVTSTNAGANTVAGSATLTVQSMPSITLLKTVAAYWDPVNGTADPLVYAPNAKNIPGSITEYTIIASNSGGSADLDSTYITDKLPANTVLHVRDIGGVGSGPVLLDGPSNTSTMTYTFTALNDLGDDLEFSNDGGATWTLVSPTLTFDPVTGCDTTVPSITHIRIRPKGTFIGNPVPPSPSFQLKFRVCVQ